MNMITSMMKNIIMCTGIRIIMIITIITNIILSMNMMNTINMNMAINTMNTMWMAIFKTATYNLARTDYPDQFTVTILINKYSKQQFSFNELKIPLVCITSQVSTDGNLYFPPSLLIQASLFLVQQRPIFVELLV